MSELLVRSLECRNTGRLSNYSVLVNSNFVLAIPNNWGDIKSPFFILSLFTRFKLLITSRDTL